MRQHIERAAFYLTCGSAISILFSIAVSQILLALAFAAVLISGERLRFPPIRLPLALFALGTVISLLLSGHAREGTPQVRKLIVFLMLLLVYSTFRKLSEVRAVILIWSGVATLSGLRGLFQFLAKYREALAAHQSFYQYYVGERITGFMSHWMTFGGEEMIVILMLLAFLFFAPGHKWKVAGWFCAAVLGISLVLGFTRSIFLLGVPTGLIYLLWFWHRWLVALVPVVAVLAILAGPASLRERMISSVEPHGTFDSNEHRNILRLTGTRMIEAHPIFGLGPEQVKAQFEDYVPKEIPRPLPEGWYGHLHNIYLQYAAERGIPTALCMFWMIGQILYDFGSTLYRRLAKPETRYILHGAIAAILAILAEGFFEYNLGDSEVLTLFLVVTAFGYIARDAALAGDVAG